MTETTSQTDFQTHQRVARRKSRQLLVAFGSCLLLCAATYGLVAYWLVSDTMVGVIPGFIAAFLANGETIHIPHPPANRIFAGVVALISLIVVLWGYYQKRKALFSVFAEQNAREMGGVELVEKGMSLRQQQYRNVVEEMAVAAGLTKPQLFILPKDNSINAFVTAGFADTVAVCVSQGALDYLSREELQALIAHEFGHIKNQDVQTNINLVAILHGFYQLRTRHFEERLGSHIEPELEYITADKLKDMDLTPEGKQQILLGEMRRKRIELAAKRAAQQTGENDDGNGFIGFVYSVFSLVVTSIMILFGRIIQATFSRQREWLADAYAVEYTRNKTALVGVLQKAIALQQMRVSTPPMSAAHTHFLFINYQNKWFSTHPPLEKRLARYGRAMYQDEVEALAYQLKQYKLENRRKEKAAKAAANKKSKTHGIADALQAANTPFPLMQTAVEQSGFGDMGFVTEAFYPLLAIRAYQQQLQAAPVAEKNFAQAVAVVLAQFILLSGRPLSELVAKFEWSLEEQTEIKTALQRLKNQHPTTHIQLFLHYLAALKNYTGKAELQEQVTQLIKADKLLSLCEVCYMICLKFAINKRLPEAKRRADFKAHEADIILLITVAATISNAKESRQQSNFNLMMEELLPHVEVSYQPMTTDNKQMMAFYHCLKRLATLKKAFRLSLLATVEKNIFLDRQISTEQNHLLYTLQLILKSD